MRIFCVFFGNFSKKMTRSVSPQNVTGSYWFWLLDDVPKHLKLCYEHARKLALTPLASAVPSYIHNEIKISMNVLVTSVAISSI